MTKRIDNEIKHFSNLDHIWWGAKTPAGQKRYDFKFQEFKKYCKPKTGYKILEIGCGDGEFTNRLAKLRTSIIATDITPEVIKRAKKLKKFKKIKFYVDNAEKMKFKDESFDIVCGISILHHIDYKKTVKEINRVLKPNGQAFFTEPNLLNPIIYAGLNLPFLRERMEFSRDEIALIRWQMEKVLLENNFSEVKSVNYDFVHPKTPVSLLTKVKDTSSVLEKIPIIKEFSGSLIIWAKK